MDKKYNITIRACFVGYIVQAVVNNFAPLLFLTFNKSFNIPISKITLLVTFNFGVQLAVDFLSAKFIDRIGYRKSIVLAHILSAVGIILMSVLPYILPSAFAGLLISTMLYAVGGGILEVLVSPIVESCPTDNKEKAMSMLHSFYCWGHVGVVLVSTLFFTVFGIERWRLLALLWAIIPVANAFVFAKAPIAPLVPEGEKGLTIKELLKNKLFWLFVVMMVCSGASEQAVSQWASAFAEKAIGISKTVGDLAGPMAFAVFMGLSRLIFGKLGDKIKLDNFMLSSCVLCVLAYLCISVVPSPIVNLIGCGLCGLSVGIMWPGSFSKAAASIKNGGTAVFALLALAGDLGCAAGPSVVGFASGIFGDNLKAGVLVAVVFPVMLLFAALYCRKKA